MSRARAAEVAGMGYPVSKYYWQWTLAVWLSSFAGMWLGYELLVAELNAPAPPGSGIAIAQLKGKKGQVQRKRANRYHWGTAPLGQSFFDRESLQTGKDSFAQLLLLNGAKTIAEVEAESLVVLEAGSETGFRLLEGAYWIEKNGNSIRFAKGASGKVEKHLLLADLVSPPEGAEFFSNPGGRVSLKLSWEARTALSHPVSVEVSAQSDFYRSRVWPVADKDKTLVAELGAGQYYWRVSGAKGPVSRSRTISVREAWPISISKAMKEGSKLEVGWTLPPPLAEKPYGDHNLEISYDGAYRELTLSVPLRIEHKFHSVTLGDGSYFLRIVSHYGGKTVPGPSFRMDIPEDGPIRLSSAEKESFEYQRIGLKKENTSPKESTQLGRALGGSSSRVTVTGKSLASKAGPREFVSAFGDVKSIYRMPMELVVMGDRSILNWTYSKKSYVVEEWQLWETDSQGNPVRLLRDQIPSTWRSVTMDPQEMRPGMSVSVYGRTDESLLRSNAILFTNANPLPPKMAYFNLRLREGAPDYLYVTWQASGPPVDKFLIFMSMGNITVQRTEVLGSQTEILVQEYLANPERANLSPDFKVTIKGVKLNPLSPGAGEVTSAPLEMRSCLGDFDGDRTVTESDIAILARKLGSRGENGAISSTKKTSLSPTDLNANGKVDEQDLMHARKFLGMSCRST